jgi:hypothetical protein
MVIEDVQWIDPTTLEWLSFVVEHVARPVILRCRDQERRKMSPTHLGLLPIPGQIAGLDSEEGRSLNVTSGEGVATDILERHNCTGGRAGLKRNGLIKEILLALHESRRRHAKREIERYDHLVQYARAHPLRFDEREGPIGPEGAPGRTRESGLVPTILKT